MYRTDAREEMVAGLRTLICHSGALMLGLILSVTIVDAARAGDDATAESLPGTQTVFTDPFRVKLGDGWTWLRESPTNWRIASDGLEIRVEPGLAGTVKNALLRPVPDRTAGKCVVEVTVTFTTPPTNQYEQAGITWYQKSKPIFKLVHEQIDGKTYIIPGKVPAPEKSVRLRLIASADTFTAQFRPEGKTEFQAAASGRLPPGTDEQVSLQCYNGPAAAEHWIRFDNFRVLRLPR